MRTRREWKLKESTFCQQLLGKYKKINNIGSEIWMRTGYNRDFNKA